MTISIDDFTEMLDFRHACKDFDPAGKIDPADWELILKAGYLAPTSLGFQAYKIVVVRDAGARKALTENAWGGQKQIPHASELVLLAALRGEKVFSHMDLVTERMFKNTPQEVLDGRHKALTNYLNELLGTPPLPERLGAWTQKQAYIVGAFMMLAAAARGIDSCPMEGIDPKVFGRVLETYANLSPDEWRSEVAIGFGFRVLPQPARKRFPLQDIFVEI